MKLSIAIPDSTLSDEKTLDQYEGINQGYYDKKYMKVGEYENVLIYISIRRKQFQ